MGGAVPRRVRCDRAAHREFHEMANACVPPEFPWRERWKSTKESQKKCYEFVIPMEFQTLLQNQEPGSFFSNCMQFELENSSLLVRFTRIVLREMFEYRMVASAMNWQ
jgi:hypothetical protein